MRWIVSALIGLMLWCALVVSSIHKPFWLDESNGIVLTLSGSNMDLIKAAQGQCSVSPLYYILDRAWLRTYSENPVLEWNLLVFFRLLPSLYFALSVFAALLFLYRWIPSQVSKSVKWNWVSRWLLPTWLGSLFATHSLAVYYAKETRPYSLWLLFSVVQFVMFLISAEWISDRDWIRKRFAFWWAFAGVSFLLTMVSSVGMLQAATAFGLLVIFRSWIFKKWAWDEVKFFGMLLIPSVLAGLWYASQTPNCGMKPNSLKDYVGSVTTVIRDTAHSHRDRIWPSILCFLGMWQAWKQRLHRPSLALGGFLAMAFLALTLPLFVMTQLKQFFVAARQYIFLVPSLMFLMALGYMTVFQWVQKFLVLRRIQIKREIVWVVFVLLMLGDSSRRFIHIFHEGVWELTSPASRELISGRVMAPVAEECKKPEFPYFPEQFNEFNSKCRSSLGSHE